MSLASFFQILPPKLPYSCKSVPIETLLMPEKITLLWYKKNPSDVAPKVGDRVKTGQDLAEDGKGPFVSTATGRIEEISDFQGPEGHGYVSVVISQNKRDSFDLALTPIEDFSEVDPVDLRAAVNRAGFTALSSISNDPSTWPSVNTLIVSALDLDPHSVVNQQIFRDHVDLVEDSIDLLARTTGASSCVIAVPDNLSDIAGSISTGIANIVIVPPIYPKGLPDILAKEYGKGFLIKRNENQVVTGNTLVISIEHAIAMLGCLKTGKPLTDKTITFSAGKGGEMKNFRVRIGMPVAEILKKADVEPPERGKLILNGLMNGYACFSGDQPITESTDSIHVQAPSEVFYFQDNACINCGKCNAICPVDLEVNFLGRFSQYGMFDKCRNLGAENCIECGLCAYVCPAHRPLVQLISHAKHVIRTEALEDVSMEEALAKIEMEDFHPTIKLFETKQEEKNTTK